MAAEIISGEAREVKREYESVSLNRDNAMYPLPFTFRLGYTEFKLNGATCRIWGGARKPPLVGESEAIAVAAVKKSDHFEVVAFAKADGKIRGQRCAVCFWGGLFMLGYYGFFLWLLLAGHFHEPLKGIGILALGAFAAVPLWLLSSSKRRAAKLLAGHLQNKSAVEKM
jgi:hypothetical protein